MKISARDQFPGTIAAIRPGAVNGTGEADGGGHIVTASITASITGEAIAGLGWRRATAWPWW